MNDPVNPYAPPQSNLLPADSSGASELLATPWQRLGASLLDSLILMAINLPLMWFTGYFDRAMEQAARGGGSWGPERLLWGLVGFIVMLALNWNQLGRGQTIGKGVVNLRIVRKNGSPAARSHIILKRILPLQLIVQIPILGVVVAVIDSLLIFRSQHNTLHDDIADTKVIITQS
ncbi:RDD family protein [Prosthecobacter sp.]|uniref:RDD family protein n=1 Tax=Prosthecobacter sp. TaxID=1965333 RepID=UPI00378529FA